MDSEREVTQLVAMTINLRDISACSFGATTVNTNVVCFQCGHYLTTIAQARLSVATGGWGRWTPQWWKEREDEALGALRALRGALEEQESG